jgi:hypothetical protein
VITDPRDADVGAILGWGFAPYTGGPISMIDTLGTAEFLMRCEALAAKHGKRFQSNKLLKEMAADGPDVIRPIWSPFRGMMSGKPKLSGAHCFRALCRRFRRKFRLFAGKKRRQQLEKPLQPGVEPPRQDGFIAERIDRLHGHQTALKAWFPPYAGSASCTDYTLLTRTRKNP